MAKALNRFSSMLVESALNIKTIPGEDRKVEHGTSSFYGDHKRCDTINYWYLNRIFSVLRPGPNDIIYDIGSGTGRVLCFTARMGVKKCVGVELIKGYCETARRNADKVRGRRAPVWVFCGDAAKANMEDGTIYFMNNPFGPQTLSRVLRNIELSLKHNPRKVTVIYSNPYHENILTALGWRKFHELKAPGDFRTNFWTRNDGAP
jgi:precorrin-6B methylase 2